MRGCDRQTQHNAREGGTNFQPIDLFAQRAAAFSQFQRFIPHIAQLGIGILAPRRLDLQDLKFGFGGVAFGLRKVRLHLAAIAIQPRHFAF